MKNTKMKKITRRALATRLEKEHDALPLQEQQALYITNDNNGAVEAVLLTIDEYERLAMHAQHKKEETPEDSSSNKLDEILQRVQEIESKVDILVYVA